MILWVLSTCNELHPTAQTTRGGDPDAPPRVARALLLLDMTRYFRSSRLTQGALRESRPSTALGTTQSLSKGRCLSLLPPRTLSLRLALCVCAIACAAVACRRGEDTSPAVATANVALARNRVAQGSPVELTYRFQVAGDLSAAPNQRVFVHVVDADEELMWTDDHDPPTATTSWKPGQTVEYTRTMFVPMYPYVGPAKVILGVYDTATNTRLKLTNTDRGDRSYQVADFELLPQTENVYLIYKDGWHPAEVAPENPAVEWKWTRKEATVTFRNPRRDSTFILQMDNPSRAPGAASEVEVRIGDQLLGTVPVNADDAPVRKFALSAAQLGSGDMVEVRLVANRTFVPALEPASKSSDTRELGVRVFHAFVQPES
jgi:hypothetical protein